MEIAVAVACAVNLVLLVLLLLRKPPSMQDDLLRIKNEVQEDLRRGREEQQATLKSELETVAKRLSEIHSATGQVVELSKGINSLNTILSKSQGRGAFGELTLDRMLADLFGEYTEMYQTQYPVEGAEKVDAAIFVTPDKSQFLSVDAKFPLANAVAILEGKGTPEIEKAFEKDVKARAEEIATKYIKPPKTLDFAFMFVPSEAVYYLVLKNGKLHEALLQRKVIPTSPNGFYAYLQALSIAFRGMKIEQKTVEIQRAIVQVAKDFARFAGDYAKVGERLKQAGEAYEASQKDVEKFTKTIDKLRLGEVKEVETK